MKRITPDINLQNNIQRDRVLDSLEYHKGKSFNYAHTWHTGIHYFNDSSNIDFVTYENVLLACKKSHLSSSNSVPVIIYDTENPLQPIGVKSEYWSFVLSGIVGTAENNGFKVGFSPNVESLPTADNHIGEIYVVGPVGSAGNAYLEYIAIHTPSYEDEYTWELIGGGNVSVDLSEYYTKTQSDEKYQPKGNYLTEIPDKYVTDVELNKTKQDILETVTSSINLQNAVISSKQNTLISGLNIKTINGQSILGEGNIEITGNSNNVDLTGYATEQWVEDKGYLTSIPDMYVTEDELNNRIQDIATNINIDGGETNFIDNGTDTI